MAQLTRVQRNQRALVTLGRMGALLSAALSARVTHEDLTTNVPVMVICELAVRGPLRPRDIQVSLGLTSGGVSHQLDRLERPGLITRSYGAVSGDRRGTVIALTEEGTRVAGLLAESVAEHAEDLISSLTETLALLRD